ncbi:chain length determinant protein tyrosine kinase EpsG [Thauera sinica]|uniref:Chain length determinant protein tyrosine kinase EpsG n=1 Tax=Thauera sinica TaxID=2665146 RepID=A0ABW1AN67_9RHOO|nr:chain length determinant protein tyrosine kinase EpsG [Thauera sp. K11]ATE60540.1 chain length determinant protein tyrosine kinase EpsG [Thauera sp. K11]
MNAPATSELIANERSIGAILVDAGRLSTEDAERIFRVQREEGLRFGDAAIKLGLVTEADIQRALSRQFDYPYLQRGDGKVTEAVIAAYEPFSPQVESLRALRSQLMLRWFDTEPERRTLAITSPARGEGRSWLTANMGVVFSQLGERTLIIDADLRNPRQHELFGVDNRAGLSAALAGRGTPDLVERIPALRDLSVLPAGAVPPNPQELLARPIFARLLQEFAREFDVILIDTPAGGLYADSQTLAVRASAALVVAQRNLSRMRQVRRHADMLRHASVAVVGTVLNDH